MNIENTNNKYYIYIQPKIIENITFNIIFNVLETSPSKNKLHCSYNVSEHLHHYPRISVTKTSTAIPKCIRLGVPFQAIASASHVTEAKDAH